MPDMPSISPSENAAAMNRLYGKTVLWIGSEAKDMDMKAVVAAAEQARAWGVDSICIKRADGGIPWFASNEALAAEAAAVRAAGCGYIPFGYCYGPKFPQHGEAFPGEMQVRAEVALLLRMAEASGGSVQADMEAEYNGAVQCAELFCALMRPQPITLSVSTWADPLLQNWRGVAAALAPCVNAWTPQRYTDWLDEQPPLPEQTCIQPGVDVTAEFGADHPARIASGYATVFVWEYRAIAASSIFQHYLAEIVARAVTAPAPAPTPTPAPAPAAHCIATISVQPWGTGPLDSLWNIAAHYYGDGELWPAIADVNPGKTGPNGWVAAHTELCIPPKPASAPAAVIHTAALVAAPEELTADPTVAIPDAMASIAPISLDDQNGTSADQQESPPDGENAASA